MMPFVFFNSKFDSVFEKNGYPMLLSAYKGENKHAKLPRLMHMHDDKAELVFIRTGKGSHFIGTNTYTTKKGDILIFNSGTTHDECIQTGTAMSIYCCAFTNLKLKNTPMNHLVPSLCKPVIESGKYFNEVETLFGLLYNQALSKDKFSEELANYLLCSLIVLIAKLSANDQQLLQPEENMLGQRVKDYIDKHYMEDLTLTGISKVVGANQYYLSHIFKKFMKYSPIQYLMRRRIGEAQSLLLNSSHSITDIAIKVGYNNPNYFHKLFMKIVGMPPMRYRKLHLIKTDISTPLEEQ